MNLKIWTIVALIGALALANPAWAQHRHSDHCGHHDDGGGDEIAVAALAFGAILGIAALAAEANSPPAPAYVPAPPPQYYYSGPPTGAYPVAPGAYYTTPPGGMAGYPYAPAPAPAPVYAPAPAPYYAPVYAPAPAPGGCCAPGTGVSFSFTFGGIR